MAAAPIPPSINPAAIANLVKLVIGGTAAAWGVNNSLFNVEGGHRAIVFNRLVGIKETVRLCVVDGGRWMEEGGGRRREGTLAAARASERAAIRRRGRRQLTQHTHNDNDTTTTHTHTHRCTRRART